ncbi:lanthionine synthetase C family protein, partial [Hyalangium sp.]|uniref:lanthionine synthetase C family protein n=1 Tax=Hyalangium sp. TaxID=2028555 RepID=UPI002D732D63
ARQARVALADIESALEARPPLPERAVLSLAAGEAGLALYHATLEILKPEQAHAQRAVECLERAFEEVAARRPGPTLYSGYTGVGWVAAHLRGRLFDAEEDPAEAVDEALDAVLAAEPFPGEYELVHGLVGMGLYALERLSLPSGHQLLERVVAHLAQRAVRDEEGLVWVTERRGAPGVRHVDMGMAHGMGGVLAFLAAACRAGVEPARPLLEGAVSWVLARQLPAGGRVLFPSWWVPGTKQVPTESPKAWCYGDPGMAVALLSAARALGGGRWEQAALAVAREVALRPPEHFELTEAGLCHGTAGLAHMHHRLFQATGEALFAETAREWFRRTLALRQPGTGLAGFWTAEPPAPPAPAEPGLLYGVAGIALALASAVEPLEPTWDRMMLLELPGSASVGGP